MTEYRVGDRFRIRHPWPRQENYISPSLMVLNAERHYGRKYQMISGSDGNTYVSSCLETEKEYLQRGIRENLHKIVCM